MGIRQYARDPGTSATMRGWRAIVFAGLALAVGAAADRPRPEDDWTFRPTVIIRKGHSQGSGSVISSVRGETLVLTAAHVVEDRGPLQVELHRYNVGLERQRDRVGWPLSVAAEVVAADRAADVAVLRIDRLPPLPYVARLAVGKGEPPRGTVVTSVGIDLGTHLSSWVARVDRVDRFEIEGTGAERDFLITTKSPQHGRSGGGLFLPSGELVGVCIGRASINKGRTSGVFASSASIHRLLRKNKIDARIGLAPPPTSPRTHPRPPITTTHSRPIR